MTITLNSLEDLAEIREIFSNDMAKFVISRNQRQVLWQELAEINKKLTSLGVPT